MVKAGLSTDRPKAAHKDVTAAFRAESQVWQQSAAAPVASATTLYFIPALQVQHAHVTVDHLLVRPQSKVAVIGNDEGLAAASYARLRPHWQITSWVSDIKTLMRAQTLHMAANLTFDKLQLKSTKRRAEMDAIIAVGWAHGYCTEHAYNPASLVHGVQALLDHLPLHGQLLIQDIALPENPDRFVLLDVENKDAAQALIQFARVARSKLVPALQGFFLETLPSPRAGTARFRLTAKWATEFFHRWRLGIAMDAPLEVTTLSTEQWTALVEQCGGRATYRAPHPLSDAETKKLKSVMCFYDEQEKPLPLPPATFSLLVDKISESDGTVLYERRPSDEAPQDLFLKAQKDPRTQKETKWIDVAQTDDDVLPWRRDREGNVYVWVRTHVARPIINTVPRGTVNLDGRRWAGYMTEPLVIAASEGPPDQELLRDRLAALARVPTHSICNVHLGVNYYAAPEYLAQRVRGLLVEVTAPLHAATHGVSFVEKNGFGLVEVLADDVLQAIGAGVIPDSKLQILIGTLLQQLGLKPRTTEDEETAAKHKKIKTKLVKLPAAKQVKVVKARDDLDEYLMDGAANAMRCTRSVFATDQAGPMGRHVMQVDTHDFIVPSALSANTAVCVPMFKNPVGRYLLGSEPRKLPIPKRMGDGDESMMHLPSFRLPESVTSLDEVRAFLADKLECTPDDLSYMGPSFFLQPHLSPERVYPFLFHAPDRGYLWSRLSKPKGNLGKLYDRPVEKTAAYISLKAQSDLGEWYMGFTPDISADMTTSKQAAPISTPPEPPQNENAPRSGLRNDV